MWFQRGFGGLASTVLRLEKMDAGSMDDEDDSSVIDSGGWSQITDASNKRKNRDSESDDNNSRVVINKTRKMEVENKVMVAFSGTVKNINNPMKLTKMIKKSIGNIKSARYLSNNRVLLFCVDKKQQEIALMTKELGGGKPVKCYVPGELDNLKGVITGVPVAISNEVLKAQITNDMVTEVNRLLSSRNGKKESSTTVVLTFNGKNLPERIKIGYSLRIGY